MARKWGKPAPLVTGGQQGWHVAPGHFIWSTRVVMGPDDSLWVLYSTAITNATITHLSDASSWMDAYQPLCTLLQWGLISHHQYQQDFLPPIPVIAGPKAKSSCLKFRIDAVNTWWHKQMQIYWNGWTCTCFLTFYMYWHQHCNFILLCRHIIVTLVKNTLKKFHAKKLFPICFNEDTAPFTDNLKPVF